jgi:ABC-type transport system substrate-binding protein
MIESQGGVKKMKKMFLVVGVIAVLALLAACTPAPAPTTAPQVIKETVVVKQTEIVAGTPKVVEKVVEKVVTATPPPATPKPAEGVPLAKPYRLGMVSDLVTTNVWTRYGPTANTVYQNYVMAPTGLFVYTLNDKRFDVVPQLAADINAPRVKEGDKTTITIKLKKGVKWSNGKDITAKDVAFTVNTAIDLELPSPMSTTYDRSYLEKAEAIDDYTVKYTWKKAPGLAKWEYGAAQGRVINAEYWTPVVEEAKKKLAGVDKTKADAWAAALKDAQQILFNHVPKDEPLAGGFSFTKWEKGAFWENKAQNWFFKDVKVTVYDKGGHVEAKSGYEYKQGDASGNKVIEFTTGPTVTSAVYSVYGTQDAVLLALKKGDIDYWIHSLGLPPGLRDQVAAEKDLAVITNPTNGMRYMSFNARKKPFSDKAFRQTMALLIDKEFVSSTVLQNTAFPLYAWVPSANAYWHNANVQQLGKGLSREQRVNESIKLLEKAGYKWEGDKKPKWDAANLRVLPGGKLLMLDGTPMAPISLIAPSAGYDPLRSTFAIWIERWANEMSIPIKAELIGFNELVARVNAPDCDKTIDMYILGWSLTFFPTYLENFHHSRFGACGGSNAGGYSNPEYDKLSEQLSDCQTYADCQKVAHKLQEVLADEQPYVVLFDTGIIEAYRKNLQFPYTETLSGLQFVGGLSSNGLAWSVAAIK